MHKRTVLHPAVYAAMALLDSQDATRWSVAFDACGTAIQHLAAQKRDPDKLIALDRWFYSPVSVGQKSTLDKATLTKIVEWKLSRGTFRPGLLQKAASNSEGAVKEAYESAKAALVDREGVDDAGVKAVKALEKSLAGIGPATATAVLCRAFPQSVAFMSDEAILACGLFAKAGDIKYDMKTFTRFNEVVQSKAQLLNQALPRGKQTWTADAVGRALWAEWTLGNAATKNQGGLQLKKSPASKLAAASGVRRTIKKP
uniref:Uncharacterized protein n=1 Tax=Pyrodinium bahamense TaxID=73915 RepID=A0A7S0B6Q4_9DINO|mmetsp:Transcript_51981/g.143918  ORF Transcript_51981/g.143918 Transcript_51981/m.143918 type:complete len:257 (+) Transcript_51981:34-804(+)